MKLRMIAVVSMTALFALACATLSGTITYAEDFDATPGGEGVYVAKDDALDREFGITSAGTAVNCYYTGWWYWTGNFYNPTLTGSIWVKVNGTIVNSAEFDIPTAKTFLPNVTFDYDVPASQLQTGTNYVEFHGKLDGTMDGADEWEYRMTVTKS